MKKIFSTLVVIISLLLTVNVFAGDIPECLLSDQAQLFFGEVVDYHPDKENPSIGVSPVKVIKGDIVEGSYRVYNSPWPMGNFTVVPGEIYLFTYYDDVNTTDIFEVTTYDTKTLKLKHVQGDMWKRFEKYLNEGKYGEARIEGKTPMVPKLIAVAAGGSVLLLASGVFFIYKRKHRTK